MMQLICGDRQVLQLVDVFNARCMQVVRPGVLLCADESATKWKEREYQTSENFIDCVPKEFIQPSKPEPVHMEVKNLCDAKTLIMLHQEGRIKMAHLTLTECVDCVHKGELPLQLAHAAC